MVLLYVGALWWCSRVVLIFDIALSWCSMVLFFGGAVLVTQCTMGCLGSSECVRAKLVTNSSKISYFFLVFKKVLVMDFTRTHFDILLKNLILHSKL